MTMAGLLVVMMLEPGLTGPGLQQARDTRPRVAAAATATISGIVLSDEAQPRPLRRARVWIEGQTLAGGRTLTTADDGSFAFTALPAGSYTVSAAKETYVGLSYGATRSGRPGLPVPLRSGETARVTLRLPRGGVITGTVLDADGAPAQGINVSVMERRFSVTGGYRYVPAGGVGLPTDDRGIYRIYGLPAGDYVVAAQPGQPNGPGAPVLDNAVHPMIQGAPSARSFTATQVFHPSAVDAARATRITLRPGEERTELHVHTQYVPLATIAGSVALASGWNDATIVVSPADNELGPGWIRPGRVDAAGAFTLPALPPGEYQVLVRSVDARHHVVAATASVTLSGEDIDTLALTPQPSPAVTGLLVFRGDTRPTVFGTEWSEPSGLPYRPIDDSPPMQVDGVRFTIQGTRPGRYFLGANLMGVRTARAGWWLQSLSANGVELLDAPVDLRESIDHAVAVFTDRADVLSGVVVDGVGNAVPDATVVVFSADRAAWFYQSRRVAGTHPDASGRYVIHNLPPGEYRVAAATDLETNEWFDPAVLERLRVAAVPLTIADTAPKTLDLTIR